MMRMSVYLAESPADASEPAVTLSQERDLLTEQVAELLDGHLALLNAVVQQTGASRRDVEPELGDDPGDRQRMDNVGDPGLAALAAVGLRDELIGAADQR